MLSILGLVTRRTMTNNFQCPRCLQRGQTWVGDPPQCGFNANGSFNQNNWNCATLNAMRNLGGIVEAREGDYTVGIVSRCDVGFGILKWYKRRGRVERFLDSNFEAGNLELAQELLGDIEPKITREWEAMQLND